MRVLGTMADTSACGYYRMVLPFAELNVGRGHRTRLTNQLVPNLADDLYDYELAVVQRICDPSIERFLNEGWHGHFDRPYIYELDDLVTHLHPTNTMAWDYYQQNDRLTVIRRIMERADGITTTTETLANELREYNDNVFVLPNCLPNWAGELRQHRREHGGKPRIVYTGGPSHLVDVKQYAYGIGRTIKRLGDKVLLISYGHPWLKELGLTDEGHTGFRPWTEDFVVYQQSLIDYDIGLAPLLGNRFNLSKSPIKLLEYRAAGVVPIASHIEPYEHDIEHGVDGFLCRTDKDWRVAIEALAEDPALLEKMRQAGYERVEGYLIKNHSHEWESVYQSVLEAY